MLFTSSTGHYATWAHRVIHSTGHKPAQGNLSGRIGLPSYAREGKSWSLSGRGAAGDPAWKIGAARKAMPLYMGHWIEAAQG